MKKRLLLALVLCLLAATLTGCAVADDTLPRFSQSFFGTFDTIITIIGYAEDEAAFQRVTEEAIAQFERFHNVYDAYNAHEGVHGLHYLNKEAPRGPVQVEPELMSLLVYCKEKQPMTGGTFNVALGAVLRIWHDFRDDAEYDPQTAKVPDMDALQAAATHTDFDDVVLDPATNTVTFLDPKLRLDLGSVAKGYATERIAQWMLVSEMPSFIISAGGNIRAGDPPRDGRLRWGAGVQDPDGFALGNPDSDTLDTLFAANTSIVTSGDYQRYVLVDGVRYHHLISPETLMPGNHFRAVTIVTEDSGLADILSTAVFLMPYEKGRAYVESLDGVEALWVLNDRAVLMTDGMRAMSKNEGASSK